MSRKKLSRTKISRRLRHSINGKNIVRNVMPGHRNTGGVPRLRQTIYGRKLAEKQKLRWTYDLKDQHVEKYVKMAIANKKHDTLDYLCQLIECSLLTMVWRLIGGSILLSRQLINHKHILVNGKVVNCCRYDIKVGDVIKLKNTAANIKHVQDLIMSVDHSKFDYCRFDKSGFSVELTRIPVVKDIPSLESINLRSVVEFY